MLRGSLLKKPDYNYDLHAIYAIPGFSEPFSALSHLLAAGVFLPLGIFMAVTTLGGVASLIIFIVSVVFLLSMSGVCHLLEPGSTGRMALQRLDHAGIFLLIAGILTPVHGILFKCGWR